MLELYTDGACSGNPGPGGWAWVLVVDKKVIAQDSGFEAKTTNNRMELLAVISGLENLKKTNHTGCKISVHTDSIYVQQGISNWINNWKKNGWKTSAKKPVKNQDFWRELDNLQKNFSIEWNWVKGHAENEFNNLCDELAVKAYKK